MALLYFFGLCGQEQSLAQCADASILLANALRGVQVPNQSQECMNILRKSTGAGMAKPIEEVAGGSKTF